MNYLLAIDGSTVATGWAIIDKDNLSLIDYGEIKAESEKAESKSDSANKRRERIISMIDGIKEVIDKYNPNEAVMEEVPPTFGGGTNSTTVLALGTVQGAMLGLVRYNYNIPIYFTSVSTWHSDMGILKSKGDLKEQSIKMANSRYGIELIYKSPSSKFNQDNASDAINIGRHYLGDYECPMKFGNRKSRKVGGK